MRFPKQPWDDKFGKIADAQIAEMSKENGTLPQAGYTPGPWQVEGNDGDRGAWVRMSDGKTLAGIFGIGLGNARLIAAAPELLAALKALLERYTALVNCGDCGHWDPETEADVIQARAVLAKAENR